MRCGVRTIMPILCVFSLASLTIFVSILVIQAIACDVGGSTSPTADDIPPVAMALGNLEVEPGDDVVFNGSRSTDNVGVVNWTWFFIYNEKDYTIYGERTTFDFEEARTYSVQLTVRDAAGNQNSTVFTVTVGSKEVQTSKGVSPWVWPVVVVIVIVVLVLSLAFIRRSGPAKPIGEDPYHLHP